MVRIGKNQPSRPTPGGKCTPPRFGVAVILFLFVFAGCKPEAAEWSRQVDPGTPTFVYRPVQEMERRDTIRLVRDLVIGGLDGDFNYLFGHRTPHVSADHRGTIFVADPGNQRIQVFDEEGVYRRTLGRSGEGPGEFSFPLAVIVAGSHLFVSDTQRGRLSRWTLDGELDWDISLQIFPGYLVSPTVGLADGSWLARFRGPQTSTVFVSHRSSTGEVISEFAPIDAPERTGYPPGAPRVMIWAGATRPSYAADSAGSVYVSHLEQHQLFAYGLNGSLRWALQVPTKRPPLSRPEKEWATEWFRGQGYENIEVSDVEWLDKQYALADVKVDGQGRIYAFHWVPRGTVVDRLPVDVYSPDGARIFAGWMVGDIDNLYWQGSWKPGPMLADAWQTARGEFIYGVREDPDTGIWTVVRHWLEFPG